jgi:hypothetical protein
MAVRSVLISIQREPRSAKSITSACNLRLQPNAHSAHSGIPACHLNAWCKSLLIIIFCCLPFALSSCGGGVLINFSSNGVLIASPSTVTFGSVPIGQTASTTVSLLNQGSSPIQIAQLNLSGQPFSVVGPTSLPVTLAAGATYSLNIQFNPTAAGTATGQLAIANNSLTTAPQVINLSGTGASSTGSPGTSSAELSALSCSNGSMTGSGTDACTVTLTAAAQSGGVAVNLSSSSSLATVPSSVTVPANSTSASFTASISSVATAQAVTMTASAGGVTKNFTLQLNAAILALSINATSVAFGDVTVNTSATQSVTLTSSGSLPVTISAATLTGAGFTIPGTGFPITLSPGQTTTLTVEFDPTVAGAATGQLTIVSNSSTNSTAEIGLSGTGTTPAVVSVAVSPTTVTLAVGATQQFTASVTGTSNTTVNWTATGSGCSGVACGTISSGGLYTAPATAPATALVAITATSVSDPSKSATAAVTIVLPSGATYYLAPAASGGNDANNGLSSGSPWLTPNHSLNCGDVIIAAASASYSSSSFETGSWGTVNCPAGNSVAWLKCVTFDACKLIAGGGQPGFYVDKSYWGVQGWEVSATGQNSTWCFGAVPSHSNPLEIHHIIFANDVANGCQQGGFVSSNNGRNASVDYLAIVGNIVYDAAQNGSNCFSGISIYQPIESDSLPGTHLYVAGNLSSGTFDANPCAGGIPTDGNGVIFDTFDGDQGALPAAYSAQAVADNNILIANGGRGLQASNNSIGAGPFASIYLRHNTLWGNNGDLNQGSNFCGELLLDASFSTQAFSNLAVTNATNGCGKSPIYAYFVGDSTTTTDQVSENWGYAASATNAGIENSAGFSYASNNTFGVNPGFANPSAPGAPTCGNYSSVPSCMAAVIANFTPTNTAATAYGYEMPGSTSVYDSLFPQWLCNVNLPSGLVTMGCSSQP